jgi:diaminopimelate decarboxylase
MEKLKYERPFIKKMVVGMLEKSGTSSSSQPVTHIDGVSVKGLIAQYGSPLFVMSETQIRSNYQSSVQAFSTRYPKVQFAWSYKTHYNNAICRIFHQEGSWAEVVSGFEYRKALNNGVHGSKIIFNGPDKSDEDLKLAVVNGSMIHIDHLEELYALTALCKELSKKAQVAIRVNMDTGVYPIWDRFGFNFENGQAWAALEKINASEFLELTGLHTHIGTYMLSSKAYSIATTKLTTLAKRCKDEFGTIIQYIDLGGGFPSANPLKGNFGVVNIPPIDEFADAITNGLLQANFSRSELPLLILESGRALVDDAGFLLGTVLASKKLSDGRKATIMDFGVNIMFTSFWYDHKISPAQEASDYQEDVVLYGPLCMNIDIIRDYISLPLLNRGDHVVVHRVGAYNMTQWMQFIAMRPAIVLIDCNGDPHIIRKKEDLAYLEMQDQIPSHLQSIVRP